MTAPRSIRAQLRLLVAAVAVPLAALVIFSLRSEVRTTSERSEEQVLDLAEVIAAAAGQSLLDGRRILEGLVERPAVASLDPARCNPFLAELNHLVPHYTNLFVVGLDGGVVCSAIPVTNAPRSDDREWFQRIRARGGFVVGAPMMGRITREWVSILALPIPGRDGAPRGYLAISLGLVHLREIFAGVTLPPDAVMTIAHRDGRVVVRSTDPAGWIGTRLPPADDGALHWENGAGISRAAGLEGIDRVWGYRSIPVADWMVYVGVPVDWVYGQTRRAIWSALGLVALTLAAVAVLAHLLHRRIAGSLSALVHGARDAQTGPMLAVPAGAPTEIAELATEFNRVLGARLRAEADLWQAIDAAEEATFRYRSILEHAAFGIYLARPDGRLVEVNPAFVRMLGYDSVEEVKTLETSTFYRDPSRREAIFQRVYAGVPAGAEEVEWVRRDGSPLHVRLYWTTSRDERGELLFEVMVEDLTERRALEERFRQVQKMDAIGRLAGGVAHDFNNRLTVIKGQAQLLLADLPRDGDLSQSALAISESAERASELTSHLLAFSRRQMARPRRVDLNLAVERLAEVFRQILGEDVRLDTALEPELADAWMDPGQLDQILLNLVLNARDAMPGGGVLTITTRGARPPSSAPGPGRDAHPGERVVLSLSDTGHGMDEETRRRAFEPFFTTKPEGKGTGLGLSTVYGLVHQAGGAIDLETAPGQGARFEIALPAAAPDAPPSPDPESAAPAAADLPAGADRTVLLVEDEPAVRATVRRSLDRGGYHVIEAGDGEAALRALVEHSGPIHLILTDVVMPGLKGPELVERIERIRPGIPALFMSGYTERDPLDGRRIPGRAFLAKPFTSDALLREVATLLRS